MGVDEHSEQSAWVSLERGPTQNAADVIGGLFVLICLLGAIWRALKGLPFDAALILGIGKILTGVGVFTILTTIYLKSWKLEYNATEIIESYSLFGVVKSSSYDVSELSSITCYHRDPTMLGIPFDTLVFEFGKSKLILQVGNWTRESLKQFVRDLTSYRSDVPVDQQLLNYIAGQYDGVFFDASDGPRSIGYADRADF